MLQKFLLAAALGLEARALTESETEAERLRAQARRALELARAINDPEAALRLKAHAADFWNCPRRAEGRLSSRKSQFMGARDVPTVAQPT
jgi:hypothetical protein